MGILRDKFLILIIFLGLLLRIILASLPGFKIDVDAWFAWSLRLLELPFHQFYSDIVWTNYTPGFLYILYFLGLIKNLLGINDGIFYLVLKLPSIIAEIFLAIFIYKKILIKNKLWAKIALVMVILNPAFIFNSSVWGQIDGLLTLMMVLSIYFLDKKNLILSVVFLGVSFLIKPQTIALIPIYGLFLVRSILFEIHREQTIKTIIKTILPVFLIIFIFSLPFFPNQPILRIFKLISNMVGDYSYTSLYAYNFWGSIGFWISDNNLWLNISYQHWGYIIYIIFWFLIILLNRNRLSIYALAALATLSFFFLPTRVHERYLYPALIFLIVIGCQMKSYKLMTLTAILSMIHFLNLYFVYVYYNEIYLNLPKILYNPILYNFLENHGKKLSVVSTAIFVLISIMVIKYFNVSKKN